MKCSNCHKKIPKGDEIQSKGSIVCEDCSLVKCSRCKWRVTKRELTEENSGIMTFSIFFISWTIPKLVRCNWCYKQWLTEKEKAEKWWKQNKRLIRGVEFLLLVLTVLLFYLKFILFGFITFLILVALLIYFEIIWPAWVGIKRYKLRKRS